jgi:hypothetical protein
MKTWTKRSVVGIGVALGLGLAGWFVGTRPTQAAAPKPEIDRTGTPEYAIEQIDNAVRLGDLSLCDVYMTDRGRAVLEYTMSRAEPGTNAGAPPVILSRVETEDEYRVRASSRSGKDRVTCEVVLIKCGKRWMFDDILVLDAYIDKIGANPEINLYMSYMIQHPWKSAWHVAMNNKTAIATVFATSLLLGYLGA